MGANAMRRHRTQRDPIRAFAQVGLPVRLSQTVPDSANFPDRPAASGSSAGQPRRAESQCSGHAKAAKTAAVPQMPHRIPP